MLFYTIYSRRGCILVHWASSVWLCFWSSRPPPNIIQINSKGSHWAEESWCFPQHHWGQLKLPEDIFRLWVQKMDDSQYLRNLMNSMPRRLEEIILKEGRTKKNYVYTTLCKTKQINSFSSKFGHLLPQKSPIHQYYCNSPNVKRHLIPSVVLTILGPLLGI